MTLPNAALLLRIYLGENERCGSSPLFETLVLKARDMGLAGATVLRGPMGFGHSGALHTAKILDLSSNLPLVIEIVDIREKIDAYLSSIQDMVHSTLMTLEKVRIVQYGTTHHGTDL